MQAKKPSEGSTGRRRHRPAIQLSTVDQARLARGEIASAEEALVQALQNPVTAVPPAGAARAAHSHAPAPQQQSAATGAATGAAKQATKHTAAGAAKKHTTGAATSAATPRAKPGAKQRPGRLTGKNTIIARNAEEQRLLDERPPHFGKI
ncbi:hypothetical protein ACU19_07955 [Actinobaculum suis]|uniref:hypothetical protein n=1 Tax=Actinobaculum suis TaxID=1657 RepID=UPI00066FE526|nr:hypothetical protein [Actinobaculum suis]KMY22786.1 hypothetical protein ACU19_07955 [Actinobaculum suis]